MATIAQDWLFNWQEIDAASDLDRLKLVLNALSLVDESLMSTLEQRRRIIRRAPYQANHRYAEAVEGKDIRNALPRTL